MLVQFTIENFCSFKDEHTISFLASSDKSLLEENTFSVNDKTRLLRTTVLYGANASGKSNLFKALHFFLSYAVDSGPRMQQGDPIRVIPFLFSKETADAPSSFELVFYLKANESEPIRYRYGYTVSKDHIIEEHLFAINVLREVMLFTREGQTITSNPTWFKEGKNIKQDMVRENATFLSVCAQANGTISGKIIGYFRSIWILSGQAGFPPFAMMMEDGKQLHDKILKFLHFADLQIDDFKKKDMSLELDPEIPDNDFREFLKKKSANGGHSVKLAFAHALYEGTQKTGEHYLPEEQESTGTQKLFEYAGVIIKALEQGSILFVDEFDASLHPLIVENLVKLFNSPKDNPHNAQLVISCQSVHIMTNRIFRRDQIWFCEKDRYGASDLYSLLDFDEHVRKDASYNKNYLNGKYGAVPFVDEIRLHMDRA